jgi:hypothetical protein
MTAGVLPGLISASTSWLVWGFPTFAFAQYSCGSGADSLIQRVSLSFPIASRQTYIDNEAINGPVLDGSERRLSWGDRRIAYP